MTFFHLLNQVFYFINQLVIESKDFYQSFGFFSGTTLNGLNLIKNLKFFNNKKKFIDFIIL